MQALELTAHGVRVVRPDGAWALVLPDPAEAVTHLWAEAGDRDEACALLADWAAILEADHRDTPPR